MRLTPCIAALCVMVGVAPAAAQIPETGPPGPPGAFTAQTRSFACAIRNKGSWLVRFEPITGAPGRYRWSEMGGVEFEEHADAFVAIGGGHLVHYSANGFIGVGHDGKILTGSCIDLDPLLATSRTGSDGAALLAENDKLRDILRGIGAEMGARPARFSHDQWRDIGGWMHGCLRDHPSPDAPDVAVGLKMNLGLDGRVDPAQLRLLHPGSAQDDRALNAVAFALERCGAVPLAGVELRSPLSFEMRVNPSSGVSNPAAPLR